MSQRPIETSKNRKILVISIISIGLILLVGLIISFRKETSSPLKTAVSTDDSGSSGQNDPAPRSSPPKSRQPTTITETAGNPGLSNATQSEKTIEEIFETDDVCAANGHKSIHREYFDSTNFKQKYKDYSRVVAGYSVHDPEPSSRYLQFLAALRKADWIQATPEQHPSKPDPMEAIRDLLWLAAEDRGNAAPLAFALSLTNEIPIAEFDQAERDDLISKLQTATRFDSYLIGFASEVTNLEDPRAVSFLARVGFLSTLAIPDWMKFKDGFVRATEDKIDLRLKITDLMMEQAKAAAKPSFALGYSVMDTAFAKAIAGSRRAYSTFAEIDRAFPSHLKEESDTFYKSLSVLSNSATCDASQAEKIRAHMQELNRTGAGLGIAL